MNSTNSISNKSTNGLLSSLKILDFSTLLPGPYATMILADMGANVLRVESETRVDMIKTSPPFVNGISAMHLQINRNKRSIILDLKNEEDIEKVKSLILEYDIIVEQFRPGVMERLGLSYEELRKINPAIIYCSLSSYGQTGPYARRAGHDINFLGLTGFAACTGTKDKPILLSTQLADLSGSMYLVTSLLACVIHRMSTGNGQKVDVSMSDAVFAMSPIKAIEWLYGGNVGGYEEGMLSGGSYYDYYRTKDDRFLSVGSLEPKFFKLLAEGLELEEILVENPIDDPNVKSMIRKRIQTKTLSEWMDIFQHLDACVEPVLNLEETENHPQFKSRGLIIELVTDKGMRIKQIAHPVKYSSFIPTYNFIKD